MYQNSEKSEPVHSERVRAGQRTYFFDVKKDRKGGHYLVLTESRKALGDYEGQGRGAQRSRIFLYAEDLNKFSNALGQCSSKMKELMPDFIFIRFAS